MNSIYKKIQTDLTSKEKFHIKLGVDRVKAVLEILGNPQDGFKSIHVAGTNGKGSTCSMLAKILEGAGYKTGLFTSPHLVKYNERIKISSEDIGDEIFENLLDKVNETSKENDIVLTEFEILTVVSFLYFKEQKVDIAVIEVGLGGRLDATNVINPIASIITSISLDHTQRLGDTIEKIAYEKAGIIKQDSKVVLNPDNLGLKTIEEFAESKNAQIIFADEVECVNIKNGLNEIKINEIDYKLSLLGDFQGENLSLVLKTLELLDELGFKMKNLHESLKKVSWHARMQMFDKNVILDGAHNPDAATQLKKTLDKYFPHKNRTWFYGGINTKDHQEIMDILFNDDDKVYFVEFNHDASLKFAGFKSQYQAIPIKIEDFIKTYKEEKKQADLIVISGSLYLLGDIIALSAIF